jgi:hypothetical protein
MTWPLIALAALVTLGGLLNAPPLGLLTRFLGGEEALLKSALLLRR